MKLSFIKYLFKRTLITGWINVFICYFAIILLFILSTFGVLDNNIGFGISLVLLLYLIYLFYLVQNNNLIIFKFAGYGICRIDRDKGIVYINDIAIEMLGFSKEEILGLNYHEMIEQSYDPVNDKNNMIRLIHFSKDKRNKNNIFDLYEKYQQGSQSFDTDFFIKKDGTKFAVEYIATPVFKHNKKIKSIIFTFKDVTDRRHMQEELYKKTQELQDSNKELESFSYSVSHDLRAPLRHISGFINLLKKCDVVVNDNEANRYINIILKSSKKMDELIEDLLIFSRVSRTDINKVQVNLKELVYDIKVELTSFLPDNRTIEWNIDELPSVMGDKKMLRLSLMNLMANAIKFTKNIEITHISILSEVTDKEVLIIVKDNGVGFDSKYSEKIFGVFQRLHKDSEFEGTGIGLANVHRIIGRHKGRVWAESALNNGATFYISLPKE